MSSRQHFSQGIYLRITRAHIYTHNLIEGCSLDIYCSNIFMYPVQNRSIRSRLMLVAIFFKYFIYILTIPNYKIIYRTAISNEHDIR